MEIPELTRAWVNDLRARMLNAGVQTDAHYVFNEKGELLEIKIRLTGNVD